MPEKEWKKILGEAKRLEKEKGMSGGEFERLKIENKKEGTKLWSLLKSQWFVKDPDVEQKKAKKRPR